MTAPDTLTFFVSYLTVALTLVVGGLFEQGRKRAQNVGPTILLGVGWPFWLALLLAWLPFFAIYWLGERFSTPAQIQEAEERERNRRDYW